MNEAVVTTHVNAPREHVFAALADSRQPFLTGRWVTRMGIVGEQTSGVGTVYRWTFTLPLGLQFSFDEVVTE